MYEITWKLVWWAALLCTNWLHACETNVMFTDFSNYLLWIQCWAEICWQTDESHVYAATWLTRVSMVKGCSRLSSGSFFLKKRPPITRVTITCVIDQLCVNLPGCQQQNWNNSYLKERSLQCWDTIRTSLTFWSLSSCIQPAFYYNLERLLNGRCRARRESGINLFKQR